MILALELRPDAALGWALDDAGAVRFARARPLADNSSPAQSWLELIGVARDLCFEAVVEPAALARVVLVFPGALSGQTVRGGGFKGYDLERGLREHLQTPSEFIIASASVADAWAQTHAGVTRGVENWLYLGLDERLESVACARGTWLSPDLGALILERDGPLDNEGRRGTLNAFCAGNAFQERARSYALNVAPAQIWEMAPTNFAAQSLAADYVTRLAQGLANGVAALSPQRICIGGALGRAIFAQIIESLASQLRDYLPPGAQKRDIVLSAPGEPGQITPGALALATLGAPPV